MLRRLGLIIGLAAVACALAVAFLLLGGDSDKRAPQSKIVITPRLKAALDGPAGSPATLVTIRPDDLISLRQYRSYSRAQFDKQLTFNLPELANYDKCLAKAKRNIKMQKRAPQADSRLRPQEKAPSQQDIARVCRSLPSQARKGVIGEMIYQRWLTLESDRLGVRISDADREIVRANLPKSQSSKAMRDKSVRQSAQEVAILRRLGLLPKKNPQSDSDYYAFYKDNPDLFTRERGPRAWVLTFPSESAASQALRDLRAGASWESVSRRVPAQEKRALGIDDQGGFPLDPRYMIPAVRRVVLGKRNQVRGPERSEYGWIIGRNTTYAGTLDPYSKVKKQVRQFAVGVSLAKGRAKLFNLLLKKYRPRTNCARGWVTPFCANGPQLKATKSPQG